MDSLFLYNSDFIFYVDIHVVRILFKTGHSMISNESEVYYNEMRSDYFQTYRKINRIGNQTLVNPSPLQYWGLQNMFIM